MNRVFAWPVGQNVGPRGRYLALLWVGGLLGGLGVGILIGMVAELIQADASRSGTLILTVLIGVTLMYEVAGKMGPFPERRRQVRSQRPSRGYATAAFAYGVGLGVGFNTWIRHAAAYGLLFGLIAHGDLGIAVVAGAVFGSVRLGIPALFAGMVSGHESARNIEQHLLTRFDRPMRIALSGVLIVMILVFVPNSIGT